jgi:PIN domain nuclease of toxin-antitoxin system
MAIKSSTGKLALTPDYAQFVEVHVTRNARLNKLRLSALHCARIAVLGFPRKDHKDPFDRALIAQCLVDALTCVSCDEKFDSYGVTRLW